MGEDGGGRDRAGEGWKVEILVGLTWIFSGFSRAGSYVYNGMIPLHMLLISYSLYEAFCLCWFVHDECFVYSLF